MSELQIPEDKLIPTEMLNLVSKKIDEYNCYELAGVWYLHLLNTACTAQELRSQLKEAESRALACAQEAGYIEYLTKENEKLRKQVNDIYEERNRVVAALAWCLPAVITKTEIEGWDAEWQNCVYLTLPNDDRSQVSWHIHDSQLPLFDHVPQYDKVEWDGHTTEEKYKRLEKFCKS